MNDLRPHFRRGFEADGATLARVAVRTFADAFSADNSSEAMAVYMAQAFGSEQQTNELTDPAIITILTELDEELIAYAQLRTAEPPPACVTGPAPIELWRFYLDRRWHGKGLAQELFAEVLNSAKEAKGETLWLGVWERNGRAQSFYRKCGFKDVGDHEFLLGNARQRDRIMSLSLG